MNYQKSWIFLYLNWSRNYMVSLDFDCKIMIFVVYGEKLIIKLKLNVTND